MGAISAHADVSPLEAGILAAAHLGMARNSRDFAKQAEIAHALVIRACVDLGELKGLIMLERRGDRSQRVFFQLSGAGRTLIEAALAARTE